MKKKEEYAWADETFVDYLDEEERETHEKKG